MDCSTPGFPVHHQLLELAQTQVQQVSDAIQPSHPLSSPSPPAFNLSQHQDLFQTVLVLRWPKYWNFSFGISPSNEYSGLISFRIDWFDLLAVHDSQESSLTPQFKSIDSSALRFLYGPTLTSVHDYWENHSFDYTAVLCQQSDSRFIITFLPKSKHLLILWLQSTSVVILDPKKIKVCHCFHCFPIYLS